MVVDICKSTVALSLALLAICVIMNKSLCHCSSIPNVDSSNNSVTDTRPHSALDIIFNKYGNNNSMTFELFEHLLYSLKLGNIAFMDHNISQHQVRDDRGFVDLHLHHNHSLTTDFHDAHTHNPESDNLVHEHGHEDGHSDYDSGSDNLVQENDHEDGHQPSANIDSTKPIPGSAELTRKCLSPYDILKTSGLEKKEVLLENDFLSVCPLLILQLDYRACLNRESSHRDHEHHDCHDGDADHGHGHNNCSKRQSGSWHTASVWGFSFLACLIISAVGLVAVAIIPIMHKVIYNHMLQFLVALAIGSLTGDAILHLLPHSLLQRNGHSHGDSNDNDRSHSDHNHAVWCGLTALCGIYLFFLVERLVGMCSERKRSQHVRRLKKHHDGEEISGGDVTSAHHIMNSSMQPVMAKGAIATSLITEDGNGSVKHHHANTCEEILMMVHTSKDVRKLADDAHDELHQHCDPDRLQTSTWGNSSEGAAGSSGHNHSHSVPGSVAAVAWMVIVGDGFHNFADGLAIGSAFADSLSGGLSTSIAVFCHELPHELGDFAMLLNAGMSAKQALIYNCFSSLLCLFGMVVGVLVGNIASATPWIFALIAGLFLYVALVDMLPEMTKMDPKKGEHPMLHLALQNSGMFVGSVIMLVIALVEDDIHRAFS